MKIPILLLLAFISLASCYKKSTADQKNYYCVKNDSLVSTIPVLSNPHYRVIAGNYDNVNQANIDFMVKSFPYMDTFFNRHDTLSVEYWTMTCDQIE